LTEGNTTFCGFFWDEQGQVVFDAFAPNSSCPAHQTLS